jgi:uncharacterized iron-regulated membrane protein
MVEAMTTEGLADGLGRKATPHRAVWRWHFYAGLFAAPVLVILATTGALYLFDVELDALWNRDLLKVEVGASPLSLAVQESALRASFPNAQMTRVVLPRSADQAARWVLDSGKGLTQEVFVNPYTGVILGVTDPARNPLKIVRDLHSTLLAGKWGGHVVELTACWTLVMLVTGVYLWWPRQWRLRVFIPRGRATGRTFWRDWHSIPALFNALLVGFLVVSGLPWSVFWGTQFAKLGERVTFVAPSPNFTAAPPAISGLPWTVSHHTAPTGSTNPQLGIAAIEPALARIDVAGSGAGLRVSYPAAEGGVFVASYMPAKAQDQRTLYIATDGKVLGDIAWRNYSPAAKAIEWGVMTHMGKQFGLANQLAGLAVCLTLVGSVVAGIVLWWHRRPSGRLGAPTVHPGDRLPRIVSITLFAMGILFPLLGVSIVVVLLGDTLIRQLCRQL